MSYKKKISPCQIQRNTWILRGNGDTVAHLQHLIIQTDLLVVLPLPLSLNGIRIEILYLTAWRLATNPGQGI